VALLESAGHLVVSRALVPDDPGRIEHAIRTALAEEDVQAVVSTGGTGISSRDGTYEVVDALLEKRLDGFGELFRMLSYEQVGAAAMLSRACAGLVARRILIALPGSEAAVRLAMEKLVVPELGHLVREATR
jgi:molybdenum cofactor biosynthesis protein B